MILLSSTKLRQSEIPATTPLPIYEMASRMLKALAPSSSLAFSKPGDSGSWVFDEKNGIWFGMIVGGDNDFLGSYVTEAGPLISYLSAALARRKRTSGLTLEPLANGG